MTGRPPSLSHHRGPGERAAALAASYCTRRLGQAYAQAAWQMLADAARLGVIRHGRPEAWAAGAVVALARVNGRLGADAALTAQQVADELDVTLGTLAVTERELARVVNLARYARRLPVGRAVTRTGVSGRVAELILVSIADQGLKRDGIACPGRSQRDVSVLWTTD